MDEKCEKRLILAGLLEPGSGPELGSEIELRLREVFGMTDLPEEYFVYLIDAAKIGIEVERKECAKLLTLAADGLGYRRAKERDATLSAAELIRSRGRR